MLAEPEVENVLLIDDNATLRREMASGLSADAGLGHSLLAVHQAGSGREALDINEQRRATVAVVDLAMPEMDGIEVAKILQARNPELSIIFLSAYDNAQYRQRAAAEQIRVVRWIDKDRNAEQNTLDTVQEVIQRKAIERQVVEVIESRLTQAAEQLSLGEEEALRMKQILDPQSIVVPCGVARPGRKEDEREDMFRRERYTDFTTILAMLSMYLDESLQGFRDPAARQSSWERVRELVTNDLWDSAQQHTDNRYAHEIVLLFEQAVRRIDPAMLVIPHVRAAYLCVERLSNNKIRQPDVSDCRRFWNLTGVDALPSFADIARNFEESYSNDTEDEEEYTDRNDDPDSPTR